MFLEHVQIRGVPIRAIMSCVGAFLICLMLGAFYTFGNIMPYLVSYMRSDLGVSQNITYRLATLTRRAFHEFVPA